MSDKTTAELIEAAKAKVIEAMARLDEARQVIGSEPTDEPTDEDNAYADQFNAATGTAYNELYRVSRPGRPGRPTRQAAEGRRS